MSAKAIIQISNRLKITTKEAIIYCESVRRVSGLGTNLSYGTIACHLRNMQPPYPKPDILVSMIKQIRKVQPNHVIKPSVSNSRAKRDTRSPKIRGHEKTAPQPSNIKHGSYFDQERVYEEKMDQCPHGVPYGRVCAICDPKKFREMTGIN